MNPTFGLWTEDRELSRTKDIEGNWGQSLRKRTISESSTLHFPLRSGSSIIANVARGLAMNWEIVATFDNAIAAETAKNMLESQGVTTFISAGASSTSSLPFGGARRRGLSQFDLFVPAISSDRARFLLDQESLAPPTDESIAEAVAASPEIAAQLAADPEPFDDTPTDVEVDRILKATAFALLFPPLQIYTLARLWRLRRASPPVRSSDRWKIFLAYALSLPLWFVVVVPAVLLLGCFVENSAESGWRSERFAGFGDAALTIDLPGQYRYNLMNEKTVLGPAKLRFFDTSEAGPILSVSIFELSQGRAPNDGHAALKQFVDNESSRADYKVRSIAPNAFGGYPSFEVESSSPRERVRRQRYVLIDHHILVLSADARQADRENAAVQRFFSTARLQ
jgi:hypothetical protein